MRLWAVLLATVMAVMLLAAPGRAEAHDCKGLEAAPHNQLQPWHHPNGGMAGHVQDCQVCCSAHCLPSLTLGLAGLSIPSLLQLVPPAPDHLTSSLDWPPPLRPPRSLRA